MGANHISIFLKSEGTMVPMTPMSTGSVFQIGPSLLHSKRVQYAHCIVIMLYLNSFSSEVPSPLVPFTMVAPLSH